MPYEIWDMMTEWFEVLIDPADSLTEHLHPGDMSWFEDLIEFHLPARLDMDSRIAKDLVEWLGISLATAKSSSKGLSSR